LQTLLGILLSLNFSRSAKLALVGYFLLDLDRFLLPTGVCTCSCNDFMICFSCLQNLFEKFVALFFMSEEEEAKIREHWNRDAEVGNHCTT
jgi:hypothetical protein